MNYIDFKRYKFSTVLKRVKCIGDVFYKISKKFKPILLNIVNHFNSSIKVIFILFYNSLIKVIFILFYKNFVSLQKKILNLIKKIKFVNFKKYFLSKINKLYKIINIIYNKKIFAQVLLGTFFIIFIYLIIPAFYNYDKTQIEKALCKEINIKCSIKGKIKYSFYPTPRIKIYNFVINESNSKGKVLAQFKTIESKIPYFSLLNKNKFKFNKINLNKAKINFDINKFNDYINFIKVNFASRVINLKNGEIKFIDKNEYVTSIKNVNLKHKPNIKNEVTVLKGDFLGDKIYIKLKNKKLEKKPSLIFETKFLNSNIISKGELFNLKSSTNPVNGNILFKNNKSILSMIFDYKDDQIIIKHSNLKNNFLDGKLEGKINLFPYFNLDLNIDLHAINFNKFATFLNNLSKEDRKNLLSINKKINGKLDLSVEKIFSKNILINSFESQIKFMNGDIFIEQFLLNLKKIGAADATGIIKNDKRFSNFNFESNIFLDDLKRFYNRFGIYNKKTTSSHIFVSGSVDLINLTLRLNEIFINEKFNEADVEYIEKEFNNILFKDGYKSFLDFKNLKEFAKLIASEVK